MKAHPDFLQNAFSYLPLSSNGLFSLACLLIAFALLDLFFTRAIRFKAVHGLVLLAGSALVVKIAVGEAVLLGRSQGYEPDQPIKFSHRIHAGENKINCVYCHTGVNDSRYAGIPPASLCLNCHNVIRSGTNTGKTEIDKIHQSVDSGTAIRWVKVHTLPDFVYFSHAQHVNVGKIQCKKCHGDVENMGRIQQVSDLSMGWCIQCHRETNVNFDNKYYASYKQHKALESGKISKVTAQDIGGNNCSKCHY